MKNMLLTADFLVLPLTLEAIILELMSMRELVHAASHVETTMPHLSDLGRQSIVMLPTSGTRVMPNPHQERRSLVHRIPRADIQTAMI